MRPHYEETPTSPPPFAGLGHDDAHANGGVASNVGGGGHVEVGSKRAGHRPAAEYEAERRDTDGNFDGWHFGSFDMGVDGVLRMRGGWEAGGDGGSWRSAEERRMMGMRGSSPLDIPWNPPLHSGLPLEEEWIGHGGGARVAGVGGHRRSQDKEGSWHDASDGSTHEGVGRSLRSGKAGIVKSTGDKKQAGSGIFLSGGGGGGSRSGNGNGRGAWRAGLLAILTTMTLLACGPTAVAANDNMCAVVGFCDNTGSICTNLNGSYVCGCPAGCNANASCVGASTYHSNGSVADEVWVDGVLSNGTCSCKTGYSGNGTLGGSCLNLNECKVGGYCNGDGAVCFDTDGSFMCACPGGCQQGANCTVRTTYNFDGTVLSAVLGSTTVNETFAEATLVNGTCTCNNGTVASGAVCQDIDECFNSTRCNATGGRCLNTYGSYQCVCRSGYDGAYTSGCIEVCKGGCDLNAACINSTNATSGMTLVNATTGLSIKQCKCNSGWLGNGATGNCRNENECLRPGINAYCPLTGGMCVDTVGSFVCGCGAGWSGEYGNCENKNECTLKTANCASVAACNDTQGSFTCACPSPWYTSPNNGVTCAGVAPCEAKTDKCAKVGANCTSIFIPGNSNMSASFSHTCACMKGWEGNGTMCLDVNECSRGTHNCPTTTSTCSNTVGSFQCACTSPGYIDQVDYPGISGPKGLSCEAYGACEVRTDECDVSAKCTTMLDPTYWARRCNQTLNTTMNQAISNANASLCNRSNTSFYPFDPVSYNQSLGYNCTCNTGFFGGGKGADTCFDVNECASWTYQNLCASRGGAVCNNTYGSFQCICKVGFAAGDQTRVVPAGQTCADVDECTSKLYPDNCFKSSSLAGSKPSTCTNTEVGCAREA